MQDWLSYAEKHGIKLLDNGPCQFCGAPVLNGVAECHQNVNHIAELLDYSDPANYTTRFLSVDALALQHCEVHGPWNNYIHFARLVLIFEKSVEWNYSLTPILSNAVNDYKRNRSAVRTPPPKGERGEITTADILTASSPEECRTTVKEWAYSVYEAFYGYREDIEPIVANFLLKR
ncbi:DUF5946 family protein [Mucilaginibacter calamicampi]|uniref:DUF5946 family protein n=1 Tax=Mucilaginibacter calamicampi TaxID=1302352 RepID=A0ABW2YU17_9SPHI